jgi:hypothetical protein
MVHSTFQHPPPHSHTLSVYTAIGKGGRGEEVREKVQKRGNRQYTLHKYSSFVQGGNSSQAGSKIQTMSDCISSL